MKSILLSIPFLLSSIHMHAADLKPAQKIQHSFKAEYAAYILAVQDLTALSANKITDWKENKAAFYKARIAFKHIEMLFSFLDPEFVKDHINGAPLPQIERKAPDLVVFDPSGFQAAEEALIEKELTLFHTLNATLLERSLEFEKRLNQLRLTERMVFEAMRNELIRIAALGITGFDAPSEDNVLLECKASIAQLQQTAEVYYTYLTEARAQKIDRLFLRVDPFFEVIEFNKFDRFNFIKTVINPLYSELLGIQKSLYIETRDLTSSAAFSVNYSTESIFDTDFLNYKYFSKYSESGDEDERIELGKLLFFDPILSGNNERACASCHQPEKAFTDGESTSLAFNGNGHLKRNAPTLINAVFNTRFFWDVRTSTPEDQIEHVLFSPQEFNTNYAELIGKLNSSTTYTDHFERAYPEMASTNRKTVSRYTIVASITAYLQSLRSFNSQFDQEMNTIEPTTDLQLVSGFNVFAGKGKCVTCHFIPTFAGNVPPLFTDTETEILGIPNVNNELTAVLDEDLGRYSNGRPKEKAVHNKNAFKTVTLRNIELTAPYMHNGVFNTLEEVVDFYNVGGGHGWGIAPENTTLAPDSLHLTDQEIDDLIYFMKTLTDTTGLTARPKQLPVSNLKPLNDRVVGGLY